MREICVNSIIHKYRIQYIYKFTHEILFCKYYNLSAQGIGN